MECNVAVVLCMAMAESLGIADSLLWELIAELIQPDRSKTAHQHTAFCGPQLQLAEAQVQGAAPCTHKCPYRLHLHAAAVQALQCRLRPM